MEPDHAEGFTRDAKDYLDITSDDYYLHSIWKYNCHKLNLNVPEPYTVLK